MGRELKIQVIADGISTKENALFLTGCGCNAISGKYYSAPIPVNKYFDYVKYIIPTTSNEFCFRFFNNYNADDCNISGKPIGDAPIFTPGINKNWGRLYFAGGENFKNLLEFPNSIMPESSYTVCMWINPATANSWTSVFFSRSFGGFSSYVPSAGYGHAIFRVSEDANINGFHDILTRQIPCNKWTFISFSYNSDTEISRCYINGKKSGYKTNVPSLPACKHVLLGGDPFQPSYCGYLSGFICYDYVKSDAEIWNLYESFCNDEGFVGEYEGYWET